MEDIKYRVSYGKLVGELKSFGTSFYYGTVLIKTTPVQLYMHRRKLTPEIDIDDGTVDNIEDLKREILSQNICGQAARKYLDSLQGDMAQQVEIRKGGKKVRIKTPHFEFDFQLKRMLDETGKNVHSALFAQPI